VGYIEFKMEVYFLMLHLDGFKGIAKSMAEREGFEPPIAFRLWLISSLVNRVTNKGLNGYLASVGSVGALIAWTISRIL